MKGPIMMMMMMCIGRLILPQTFENKTKLEKPCARRTARTKSTRLVSTRYNQSLYTVQTIKAAYPLRLSTP